MYIFIYIYELLKTETTPSDIEQKAKGAHEKLFYKSSNKAMFDVVNALES